jgi:D-beta-D-heptose 7-phosphate kinase/D-beta-D-heptose 1-phosphate adenosyltransferase
MKILVIGEYCKDEFVYCSTNRLSPEAPVPVVKKNYIVQNDGMAGNVVRNLIAIEPNALIRGVFQKEQITKTRYIDEKSNHMFLRVDEESDLLPFSWTDYVEESISQADAVVVSDYDKGYLNQRHLFEIAKASKFCILDSKKILADSVIDNFDFVKLNEKEYERNKAEGSQLSKFIVTLGSKGAMYMNNIYESPSPKETIDVSGAGDTFISAFTIQYLKTKDVVESIKFANQMCSIVVSKRGVVTP